MGVEGIEQFVATPEAHSDQAIESDPLPPGQVWTISPGGNGLAPSFRESVRYGEQNLYTQAKELVGDRDPRAHEFSLQLRSIDADTTGHGLGLGPHRVLSAGLRGRAFPA